MNNLHELLLSNVSKTIMQRSLKVFPLSAAPEIQAPLIPLLLYVHIPFCEELCPYCSFFKVPFEKNLADSYFDALEKEIRNYHKRGFLFDEVYIGGGTPTVWPERLERVLNLIRSLWTIGEVSVETNPNHLVPSILKILKDSGVTRLSVGVQTFDDELLKKLKRFEKYGSGLEIQQKLKNSLGMFNTLNVDFIFNFPDQTEEMLKRDIQIINDLNVDQVTFYPLMSSSSVRNKIVEALGSSCSGNEKKFYKQIVSSLSERYGRTSSWCFTRRGNMNDEYIVSRDDYIGVGAGAFFYLTGSMFTTTFSISEYIRMIGEGYSSITMGKNLNTKEKLQYSLLMSFFGGEINIPLMRNKYGGYWFIPLSLEIGFLFLTGAVKINKDKIKVTENGQYTMLVLMRDFFTLINNIREQCRRLSNQTDRAA